MKPRYLVLVILFTAIPHPHAVAADLSQSNLSAKAQAHDEALEEGFRNLFFSVENLAEENKLCREVTEKASQACLAWINGEGGTEAAHRFEGARNLAVIRCRSQVSRAASAVNSQTEELMREISAMEQKLAQAKQKFKKLAREAGAEKDIAQQRREELAEALQACAKR